MIPEILDSKSLDTELLRKLSDYINNLEGDKQEQLIHVLHKAQELFGYLPYNLQLFVARKLDLSAAKVNGVVTFYSFFNETPTGKYTVSVCMGTACFVKGAEKVLNRILDSLSTEKNVMTPDELFTVKDVRCIGACGLAPIVTVNDKVYGNITVNDVEKILQKYRGDRVASE